LFSGISAAHGLSPRPRRVFYNNNMNIDFRRRIHAGLILCASLVNVAACGDEPRAMTNAKTNDAAPATKASPTSGKSMTPIRIEEHFDGKERDLADAAAAGNRSAIKNAIAAGANVNFRSAKGMPLLLWPMHKENPDGFAALLDAGANANQIDHRGSPVATFAAKNPDIRYLESLLRAGANPNARNTDREPLTFVAAMEGNWPHVQLLIERGAEIDAFNHENYGDTLLAYYAYGQFDRAFWLLERGADPTLKVKDALVKTRIGAQPILELIFHYKIDAKAFPQGVAAQKKCQEFVMAKGIKSVPEPNYLKDKSQAK
jgi:uncharacterized protein